MFWARASAQIGADNEKGRNSLENNKNFGGGWGMPADFRAYLYYLREYDENNAGGRAQFLCAPVQVEL